MPPTVPVNRGSIWWANFAPVVGHEQDGRRPAMVISADGLNQGASRLVIVAIMTSQAPKVASHVLAQAALTGCPRDGTVMCEHVRTISVDRLDGSPIGQADSTIMALVDTRVRRILAL
jgi:mRNA interferase MazF